MLEYDRIDISEGIDIHKTNKSKECKICHYWYFKDIGFKYKPNLCNGCHGLLQKAVSFNNIAIVYVKESAYRVNFWYINKDDAINMMNNSSLILWFCFINFFMTLFYKISFFVIYKKWVTWLIIKETEVILNRAKDYYKNDKERLRQQARDKYKNLSEEDKNEKRKYGKNRYHNMSEEKKQKLKEYQKTKYQEVKKSKYDDE